MNSVLKLAFVALGSLFLAIGILGIFLPLLPATPFLLLASACYMRGSDKLHAWLLNNRFVGAYIRDFQQRKGLPLRVKIAIVLMLWASLSFSIYIVATPALKGLLILIGLASSIFILRIRTRQNAIAPPA